MIFEAAIGLTCGMALAVALAGLRGVRNWLRAARWIAFLSLLPAVVVLVVVGLGQLPRLTTIVALVAVGGVHAAASTLRWRPPAVVSPKLFLASGLLLVFAVLIAPLDRAMPFNAALGVLAFGVTLVMPVGVRDAINEWRGSPRVANAVTILAVAVTMLSAGAVLVSLLARGAWLDASPGSAWLAIAWLTSSGSLLMKPGRPRAALALVAAVTVVAALCQLSL